MRSLRRLGLGLDPPQFAIVNSLFYASEQGLWYDPSDLTTLFQDSAGTTPVTAAGQVVGKILDKSGRGNHATQATTASKPTLEIDGSGKYYLSFDGTDDFLTAGVIDFSATDEMTVVAGVRKLSDANLGFVAELSTGGQNGSFGLAAPRSAGSTFGWDTTGTVGVANVTASVYSSPYTGVITGRTDISAPSGSFRLNGVTRSSDTSNRGTGNFSATHTLWIGRRAGTSFPFNGRLYNLIIRNKLTSGSTLTSMEAYVAAQTGVAL